MNETSYVVKLKPHQAPRIPSLLGSLDIELTERCNNACIHCLINQSEHDAELLAREMSTELVMSVLAQAADMGCMSVRFTGGEPLLRDDFAELYLFARRLGMFVILFTNARLITPEIAQLLQRIPPGRVVEVTVYGMHPESYEAVSCSRGSFSEFWRGIGLLREYKIPFIVKQSVLPPNRAEQAEFEAFASSLQDMDPLPAYAMNFDLRVRRDNPAKNRFIETLRLSPDETVQKLVRDPGYRKDMREFSGKFMRPPGEILFRCGAGHGLSVDAYGWAHMCLALRAPEMAFKLTLQPVSGPKNATPEPGSLRYALTEFFPSLTKMRAQNPDYLERCARCFLKGLCEQCPAKSWMEHGSLDTPVEYLCEVAHAQARALGLLAEGEHSWEIDDWRDRIARFSQTKELPATDISDGSYIPFNERKSEHGSEPRRD